jgi:hypothetical protein
MMTGYALVFLACFGGDCRQVRVPFDGTLMQCMLFGQQVMAQWIADRPGSTISGGYRCTTEEDI